MTLSVNKYQCNACKWVGDESTIEWEVTETCMGSDKIEMCPKCGCLDVKRLLDNNNDQKQIKNPGQIN